MEQNAFSIQPMSNSFSLKPGQTETGHITIINPADSTSDFHYKVSVSPYGVVDTNYDADLVTETTRTQIAKWITIKEPTGTVAPGKSKEVEFTITVPENVPGGGQYAAITVSSNQEKNSSDSLQLEYVYEIASIVYADIAGKTVHGGEITENSFPTFVTKPPVTLHASFTNTGNIHEYAYIDLTVTNYFSGDEIFTTKDNNVNLSEVIMPETTRVLERNISNLPSLGVITVSHTIRYNGQTSEVTQNVIICPLWFILLVAATICAIIFATVTRLRKHSSSRKRAKSIDKED